MAEQDLFKNWIFEYKDDLRVRLVNMNSNKEDLKYLIHEPVGCGYALMVYMMLSPTIAHDIGVRISRTMAVKSGHDTREIMDIAMKNTIEHAPAELYKLADALFLLPGMGEGNLLGKQAELTDEPCLLVLKNQDERFGATALFYPDIQRQVAETVQGDYFVLPSSVHEVLILKDDGTQNVKDLVEMVKNVNDMEVAPEEQLGNKVMHYRKDLDRLEVVADLDRETEREGVRV